MRLIGTLSLIGTLIGTSAHADTISTYLRSCRGNYVLVVNRYVKLTPEQQKKNSIYVGQVCEAAVEKHKKNHDFDTMIDPMYKGCFEVMSLVPNPSLSKDEKTKLIAKLRVEQCGDLAGR